MRCAYCGSRDWLTVAGVPCCAVCGLDPASAAERAAADQAAAARRAEHRRRAALVVAATAGMPMRARTAAAVYLLHIHARLPSGEPWDRVFEDWRIQNGVAEQRALPV